MRTIQTTKVYNEIDNAFRAGYRKISAQGSSRSSKTYNIVIWLISYALAHPKSRVAIVRKSMPTIKGSVYHDFVEIMKDKFGIWSDKEMNKSGMVYHFANGSEMEFFGCDNEQKMRGRKRHVLYCNEANELTFMEFNQLIMRTTVLTIIDYNPSYSDEHWICSFNREPKTYHFITTYKDNPFLEDAVIEQIESLKDKNETLWRVYGLGLQGIVEGLVFKDIDIIQSVPPSALKWRRRGMDFGYTNDPTAIVDVYIDGKDLYIDEICYRTQMLTNDIIAELKPDRTLKTISESADPRLVQEIYRAGINIHPVVKFRGSLEAGITKMQEYRLHVTAKSDNVIKELRNYTYAQDKEGKWLNVPIDAFNHAIDAVRYVVLNEVLGGAPRKVDIGRLSRAAY